jgi:hypothetical protein
MRLTRNVKQNGATGIIGILTVVAHLFLMIYGDAPLEYADTLSFGVTDAGLEELLDAAGKDIVPVEFGFDTVIQESEGVGLLGALDFDAKTGDVLIFRKKDGKWVEVGRYLTEGD